MPIKESGENYLETILMLDNKTGFVRSIDVAQELDYSKASISRAMSILKENGYIDILQTGQIVLSTKGQQKAGEIYERHRLISQFLVKTLGVNEEIASKDACRIEHVISNQSFEKIKDIISSQTTKVD